MKNIKTAFLSFIPLASIAIVPTSIVSCSSSKVNQNKVNQNIINNKLKNFIAQYKNQLNSSCVSLTLPENEYKTSNLFTFLNDPSNVSVYFSFDKNFDDKVNNADDKNRYSLSFDFTYDISDSFGTFMKPTLSANANEITIPVLVYLFDNETGSQSSMYTNLFTLEIVNKVVESTDPNNPYKGNDGKSVVFRNEKYNNGIVSQAIPTIMADKYLHFVKAIESSQDWRQGPIYNISQIKNSEWNGKTLSEVRQMSQSITSPSNYCDKDGYNYSYSISNSFFSQGNREYADFVMKISLSLPTHSSIIDDAKKYFNLVFEKNYSYTNDTWSFAQPSSSDINSYVETNKSYLSKVVSPIQSNINLYTPFINLSPLNAREMGVDKIVENVNQKGYDYFIAPNSFVFVSSDEQERDITFSIENVEKDTESSSVIKINLKIQIDHGDLAASSTVTKKFDIDLWKFV